MIPFQLHRRIPLVRRPFFQRDQAIAERDRLAAERDALVHELKSAKNCAAAQRDALISACDEYAKFTGALGMTLQYRLAYFESMGHVAPGLGLPVARPWPDPDDCLSYDQKLLGLLDLSSGKGAEIGPLNTPIISKLKYNILYVDHLDTDGIKTKYPRLSGVVEVDRPIVNGSLTTTLQDDAPLDYVVASHVLEHVANPIRWLQEVATVLREGGLLSLALPDRRFTFDLLREETTAADMVSAYITEANAPDVRSVYDHHSLASVVNMQWARQDSVYPEEVINGRGSIKPVLATSDHLAFVDRAKHGEYLDVHAWVFTPPSFLLVMAKLAEDGFLPFRLRQYYPANPESLDRGNSSLVALMERVQHMPASELRRSFLAPLGQ